MDQTVEPLKSRPSSAGSGISRMSDQESEAQGVAMKLMEQMVVGTQPPPESGRTNFSIANSEVSRDDPEQVIADRIVHGIVAAEAAAKEEAERKKREEADRILSEEVKRKAAEEEARQKAAEAEERRKAQEEAARLKALAEEAERQLREAEKAKADEAAAELARRKAAEEQARLREEARLLEEAKCYTARSNVSYVGSCASAVSSELEGNMATSLVTKLLDEQSRGISKGTAVSDAIDVKALVVQPSPVVEGHELLELFFAAPFAKIDHDAFKAALKDGFLELGAKQSTVSSVTIDLRAGSTVAEVRGPPPAIKELRELDMSRLNVMGYFAKMSADELKKAEEEDEKRRAFQEEEARRKNLVEQQRLEAIAKEQEEIRRLAEEEAARLAAEGKAKEAEEARQRAEAEQLRLQKEAEDAEAVRRKAAENEAKAAAIAAEKARREAEEEAARLAAAKQKAAEEEDAAKRKLAEEEARLQEAAVAEANRKAAEEALKLKTLAMQEARQRSKGSVVSQISARSAGSSACFTVDSEALEGEVAAHIMGRLVGATRRAPPPRPEDQAPSSRSACSGSYSGT